MSTVPYLLKLTPKQVATLSRWTHDGADSDDVRLDECGDGEPGRLYVAQGNARIYIDADGGITETRRA
jgi:hypothetical protein